MIAELFILRLIDNFESFNNHFRVDLGLFFNDFGSIDNIPLMSNSFC